MLRFVLLVAVVCVAVRAESCLKCLCQVDTGCTNAECSYGPTGEVETCGYFRILLPYYEDCGQPGRKSGEPVKTAFLRCIQDYDCASGCVEAYVKRYKSMCSGVPECQQMARLHNGGPNGCKYSSTINYWNRVKACCGCS